MTTEPTPLSDEEIEAIRALWGDIRGERLVTTNFGAVMVPVDIDLFDAKLSKVFAEVDRLKDQRSHARRRFHQLRVELEEARGEVAFHHTWDGLMALVEQHYPEEIFPTVAGPDQRDPGPRIVSLVRWVDQLRADSMPRAEVARAMDALARAGGEAITERDAARMERDALAAKLDESETRRKDLFRRLGEHMDDLGDARTENMALAEAVKTVATALDNLGGRVYRDFNSDYSEVADSVILREFNVYAEEQLAALDDPAVRAALGETGGTENG
jgi:hypothetical protein